MNIALVQLQPVAGEPEQNRDQAVAQIAQASDKGADLVVLPELFTVGYFAFDAYESCAEAFEGPTVDRLTKAAIEHEVAILGGSFIEDLAVTSTVETPNESGLANTSVLIDAGGAIRAWYRKRHLFGYESEEATRLVAGDTIGVAELDGFTIGITTCFDLRFPELYVEYLNAGVTLMLVPSAWPSPRPLHWETLTRARAIENQWYLVAVNGAGTVAGVDLLGHSAMYDPWGQTVVSLGEAPSMEIGEANANTVEQIRAEFPVVSKRLRD